MSELFPVVGSASRDANVLVEDGGQMVRVPVAGLAALLQTINEPAIVPDTTPPTISLACSSSTLTEAGGITLTATAADNVGVVSVAFFRNSSLISAVSTAPYEFTDAFDLADNGTYTYYAVALDEAGNATTTNDIDVMVNIPTPDTTAPEITLASSVSSLTAAGSLVLTATASDNIAVTSVEFYRDGELVSTQTQAPYTLSQSFTIGDNGTLSYTAVGKDAAGNVATSNYVPITVNIAAPIPHDSFADVADGVSIAGTAWDVSAHAWDAKTFLSGDAGKVKVGTMPSSICANYLSQEGDVGHAVFFTTTAARSSAGNLLSIAMDCLGSTPSHYQVNGVEALLNGSTFFYLKNNVASGLVSGAYDIVPGNEYCLEICRTNAEGGKTYNARLSNVVNGVRGSVIRAQQLVIATAHTSADRVVQIRTSTQNAAILRFTRVEALTVPFDVAAETATVPAAGTTTTAPKVAPVYLFPETAAAIPGPAGLEFHFGPAGASAPVEMVEKLYTDMPVGFGAVTQSCWASRPITVNGIQFVLYPTIDSDGRVSCPIYGAFGTATTQTPINREHAAVEFRWRQNGVFVDLYDQGTTYSYNHQRSTWLSYESRPMPLKTDHDFITGLINSGVLLKHDSRASFGADENSAISRADEAPLYRPFKEFSATKTASGAPKYDQKVFVGDQYKGTTTGGERNTIGPIHGWLAQLICELGPKNNPSWLTANKVKSIQNLGASVAQYPHSALIFPVDGRLIDPSQVPLSTHRNSVAWWPCVGIPHPGMNGTGDDANYNAMYDNAHRSNLVSKTLWHLTKDPRHLLMLQGQAITCLAYCTGKNRGADGKILRITPEEERGFWLAFQTVIHAWHATPAGPMPKPFRDKADFEKGIVNTLQFIRDNFMQPSAAYSGPMYDAARFWRVISPFQLAPYPGEVFYSPYMCDYGNIVLGEMLLLGYSAGRDVVEWHSENIRLRAQAGGNWYIADKIVAGNAGLGQSIGLTTETTLPYTDLASFKAWYPRPTAYKSGALDTADWKIDYGRDTYMFTGVLNLYAELVRRGLVTLTFNAAAEEQAMRDRHPGPYVDSTSGLKLNYEAHPKQIFSYGS